MHWYNRLRALGPELVSRQAKYQRYQIIIRLVLLFLEHLQRYPKSILLLYQRSKGQPLSQWYYECILHDHRLLIYR